MRPFVLENPPLMNTPEGRQMAEYIGRQFEKVHQSLLEANRAVRSGHAGIFLDVAHDLDPDVPITNTPIKIGAYDSKLPENGATSNIANGTIAVHEFGVWAVGLQVQWQVTPITQNDTGDLAFFLYDETAAEPVDVITSAVLPRYGSTVAASGLVLSEIPADKLDHEIALYVATLVGSRDVIVEQINVQDLYVFRVSNYEYEYGA